MLVGEIRSKRGGMFRHHPGKSLGLDCEEYVSSLGHNSIDGRTLTSFSS